MSARILIVEDNPANQELMRYLLEAFTHQPMLAGDGASGVAMARELRPDLIVCDIQLPDMDGFAVVAELRADPVCRELPILAVTALAMAGDRERILAAGFDAYLAKPIDAETFVGQIEAFLPAALRSPPRPDPGEQPPEFANRGTVLVVDDHLTNLNLMRSLLEPHGYVVLIAHGMTEALEIGRRIPPNLIISDIGMCDGSGLDFIQIVKADARLRPVPFIFITSTHCDEISRQRGLALGANRFFFRPMEPDLMLAEIEACLLPNAS